MMRKALCSDQESELLLVSSNSNGKRREHFCLNCLQGFHSEASRDKHFEYCVDSEVLRIDMAEPNFFVRFHSGQYQFKVPLAIYADLEAILHEEETKLYGTSIPEAPYSKRIYRHVSSGFCTYSTFAYGEVQDPLKALSG